MPNSPYIPSFLKSSLSDTRPAQLTFKDLIDTNISSTSSFKYEPLSYPLKSTQQLNVDWSKFENHTFFSSAEVKVNVAFDQIINNYPFDGTKAEVERFIEKLSGFEKWVFDSFPTFGGQLHFSGTQTGEDPSNGFQELLGTWIGVKDSAGWLYPELSKNKSGESIINPPPEKSFTIEAQVFIPNQANDTQIILQKMSQDLKQGFTIHLEPSSNSTVTSCFSIISGSVSNSVNAVLEKGKFNHICVSLNREYGNNFLQFFVDEELKAESKKEKSISYFNDTSNLLIGSGSSFYVNETLVTPQQTLSGTLDELRIFHSYRTLHQQMLYASKGMHSSDSLKLYYRFNEPSSLLSSDPSDLVNSIVLDSSGNSLHAYISNFDISLRQDAESDSTNPMINENKLFKKILFPYNPSVVSLNSNLLSSASFYDQQNPNLITKLIPRHYLREGALEEGYPNTSIDGSIGDAYSGEGIPGQGKIGSVQIILTFLYIWAKFFDEIKMFADAFKTLRTVDYDVNDTVPSNFLIDFIKSYGLYLPPLFNSSNLTQYVDGEDVTQIEINDYSLKQVQEKLLRRVLINMPDVLRSKGTQHSIRSFLRSIGMDPDNTMRIREFGGPSIKQFGNCREKRTEYYPMVNFVSSSLITTPFLSASRVEPGYPLAVGPFSSGISTNVSDGLLTSGSWTFEGLYKYNSKSILFVTGAQSLARLEVTGSSSAAKPGVVLNLVSSGSLYAFIRPGVSSNSPTLTLELDADVLNGEKWNISVGCNRNDSINSKVSSSYFLRAASQNNGDLIEVYSTSSFFNETPSGEANVFRTIDASLNASGSRIAVGNDQNIPAGSMGYFFLNSTLDSPKAARASEFNGLVSNLRFWSKGITDTEWREHVKNYKSVGVEDPTTNYNYINNKTGSFERLRLSILEKQNQRTASLSGQVTFFDFSENGFDATGTGFAANQKVHLGDVFSYSYLSPYFDEYSSGEKIRVRGFENEESLLDSPVSVLGKVYELPAGESVLDDPRFSIEISLIDTLNKDIINMFATFDELSNAIGSPELQYSPDYPALENLRNIYFNRLSEKLSFKNFFNFYRWFDLSIGTFIQQLVPRKTKFKGTNFVIESHMLERHKIEYQSSEIYLGDSTRERIRDVLLSQQVAGKISKY